MRGELWDSQAGDPLTRWWLKEDKEELAREAWQTFLMLDERDKPRQDANLHHLRLYGNLPVEGVNPSSYNRVANEHRVAWNVVANICDFVQSRIGKQQPAPRALTTAGNYSLRRKAQMLDRFLKAQFRLSKVYPTARRMFLDALVFGTGVLKVFRSADDRIAVERIFPSEILVDHHEALYGEPRQLMQRKWVSRDVLAEMFSSNDPEEQDRLARVIRDAGKNEEQRGLPDHFFLDDGVNDQVLVVEAWHLPSGPGATDGKHVIMVDSGYLHCERYTRDTFPFLFFNWKDRLRGFWGMGLAEELNGIQVEINRMLIKIQSAYHLMAKPLILVEANSKMVRSHFTNEIGTFVPYTGAKPEVWVPPTFHPEFYAHLDRLYQKAYEIAGISQDAASPKFGADTAGIAVQYRHDYETDRFSPKAMDWEQVFLDLGEHMLTLAKEIAAAHRGQFAVAAEKDRNTIESIDWQDVKMKEDEYILQVVPESYLPQLPGPRIERILGMIQGGLITDPREAKELLDFPDFDAYLALDRAASDDIERIVEKMLDEGEYEPPEPYMDLQLALKKVQQALNKAKRDGVEEDRLDLLRDFLMDVHALQQRAAVEQQKLAIMAGQAGGMQSAAMPPAPGAPPAPGIEGQPPTAVLPTDGA